MDVNETLKEMRKIISDMSIARYEYESAGLGEELRGKFQDLDEWLSKGGSLPRDWQAHRVIEDHFAPRED